MAGEDPAGEVELLGQQHPYEQMRPSHAPEREHFERVAPDMAEAALESGSPGFNPRVPGADEIVALYASAYDAA